MGKPWHPECFTCTICVKPLTPETYKEHGGKPYCEYDYHKLFSPKCAGCNTPITDVRISLKLFQSIIICLTFMDNLGKK
jgi:hypothetical protein